MADSLVSAVDSSVLEVGNPAPVPGADTWDMEDRVDTLVEIEAPPMEMRAMSQTHARGG
jgi:hypothetical protein